LRCLSTLPAFPTSTRRFCRFQRQNSLAGFCCGNLPSRRRLNLFALSVRTLPLPLTACHRYAHMTRRAGEEGRGHEHTVTWADIASGGRAYRTVLDQRTVGRRWRYQHLYLPVRRAHRRNTLQQACTAAAATACAARAPLRAIAWREQPLARPSATLHYHHHHAAHALTPSDSNRRPLPRTLATCRRSQQNRTAPRAARFLTLSTLCITRRAFLPAKATSCTLSVASSATAGRRVAGDMAYSRGAAEGKQARLFRQTCDKRDGALFCSRYSTSCAYHCLNHAT